MIELADADDLVAGGEPVEVQVDHIEDFAGRRRRGTHLGKLQRHHSDAVGSHPRREAEHHRRGVSGVHLHVVDDGGEGNQSGGVLLDPLAMMGDEPVAS